MKQWIKKVVWGLIVIGIVAGATGWYLEQDHKNGVSFKTTEITRGDMLTSIDATGTVEPEEVVDVGAQVAGQILSFGKDVNGKTVDYGSIVEEGTILARIDDSLYASQVAETDAQLQAARAAIKTSEANLAQMRAKLNQADRDWQRAKKLGPSEALAQSSYDAYQAAFETAEANVSSAEAGVLQAKANVSQTEAALDHVKQNLGYCTIKSPVKGVIIDRRVNIGQTVVASLNTPSLFLIAKDLTRMQVWVAVNEADIGKIYPGQPVTFTVDSFPGENFIGAVGKVRLNASMTQNVVTYTVEILTDNSNVRLLPYLTANVKFEIKHLKNVWEVPNAALRWMPSAQQVDPAFRKSSEGILAQKEKSEASRQPAANGAKPSGKNDNQGVLWILAGQYVQPVYVRVGVNDGNMTQVEGEGITEGMKIVTGIQTKDSGQADTKNPFAPQFMRGGRSSGAR
ncbi:MAG: efflux RND transporter periplasmic adaptor subunit [Desulfobacteraceae bacterium]|nr:efflux RND transporter periplasmic adaptor subunit [Desulfobacteraceae bacterium]